MHQPGRVHGIECGEHTLSHGERLIDGQGAERVDPFAQAEAFDVLEGDPGQRGAVGIVDAVCKNSHKVGVVERLSDAGFAKKSVPVLGVHREVRVQYLERNGQLGDRVGGDKNGGRSSRAEQFAEPVGAGDQRRLRRRRLVRRGHHTDAIVACTTALPRARDPAGTITRTDSDTTAVRRACSASWDAPVLVDVDSYQRLPVITVSP